ncbi:MULTISPECIES: class A sortase [Enterococcus]|uniref:Class A sortase n=1 Tax=Enterococcus avium TaxID=33945 RepID=A0A437UQ51_ENTAV|nr:MULTISPECIES: class A sortase [Enterococcus]AYQ23807.1 class A sortase [Enterococcus avium]MDU3858752.1 class A sortase [Enterococcus avium]MDU3946785.1 class A sortase [Enterococcus avium]QCQ13098.1 class A sortase [Enterococcus avium]RGY37109.1 class A sortase [Enterococcus avium]
MKKLWKNLPFLWIVLGIVISCASYYGYYLLLQANDHAEQMTHPIEINQSNRDEQKKKLQKATYCPRQIKPVTPAAYAKAQLRYNEIVNQWGVGALYIPSADIHSKILAGIDNQNLMVGVGTYYQDQHLGKSNYVLLAHNLVQGGGSLKNLPKTTLHQVFYLTDFTNVYEYVAIKNDVVDQSRGDLMAIPTDDQTSIVTLIRCEGGLNTSNRAVVQGEFLKEYPASEASKEVKLGLGLIEENWINDEKNSFQQSSHTSEESPIRIRLSPGETSNEPIYSPFQVTCIYLFTLLNEVPVVIGIGYLIGLLALTHIATQKQYEF